MVTVMTNKDDDINDDPREDVGKLEDEGDLNFATDSTPGFTPADRAARRAKQEAENKKKQEESETAEHDPNKTWVPSESPTMHGEMTAEATDDETLETEESDNAKDDSTLDPDGTWVPIESPTQHDVETSPGDVENKPNLNDTWVPDSPSDKSADENEVSESPESLDVDKTWVPTETPTINGELEEESSTEAIDTDKTWVPDDTPTHHDFSFDESGESESPEDDGFEKTFVPTNTPTFDGTEGSDSGSSEDDPFQKTAVINSQPDEADGSNSKDDNEADSTMGTVVMPRGDSNATSDSAVMDTVNVDLDNMSDADGTVIFSKTMGMRGLTEDEYDEWQDEVAEKSISDTDMFDEPPAPGTDSTAGKRTQIWSKQSSDGLDFSLTIRSTPVAGDDAFEAAKVTDKPDYQIVEKLAEGGMGAIYVANQTSLDREIAIKTLKPLKDHERKTYESQGRISQVTKQRREMFLSEALVTANLVHPHIIPIHDLCETSASDPFYVMKRVNGTPWNELITEMSQEENLEVLHKVCDAMAYAHHNGVVNRDLKPENIMLGEFGEVLVLDWGLAVPASEADKKRFASPSASFGAGTPAYMSPELWTGPPENIGTWSDIYLLGAILFEMVTGKAPHKFPEPDSKTGNSGLWMIIDNVVRKNEIRASDVTGELMDIAMKAMATKPKDRHRTVLEFQEAVKSFQKHEESRRLALRAAETLNPAAIPRDNETDNTAATSSVSTDAGSGTNSPGSNRRRGYQDFQTAAALYEESWNAWPENNDARSGLRQTRLEYATLAHQKGDYDLGLQIAAQEEGEEFSTLMAKLKKARRLRNGLKYATMAAACIIVLVGAFATAQAVKISRQKEELVRLNGTKEQLEATVAQAEEDVVEAGRQMQIAKNDQKKAEADRKQALADQLVAENAKQVALTAQRTAEAAQKTAEAAQKTAETEKEKAVMLTMMANKEKETAEKEKAAALVAKAEAETEKKAAEKEREAALLAKANADKQTLQAKKDLAALDVEKVRADVELKNTRIASMMRRYDYPAALQQVTELIDALNDMGDDSEYRKLPESERAERLEALEARRRQLKLRTSRTDAPVQAQAIGNGGRTVVWGDSSGHLTLRSIPNDGETIPAQSTAELKLDAAITSVHISSDQQLVAAATSNEVHLWEPKTKRHDVIEGHAARVTTVRLGDNILLAGDEAGNITSWSLTDQTKLWSFQSTAAIRDIALMTKARIFLYAGSRGGESSDVLAYQLPPIETPTARPKRLGQLRFPRNRINPPRRIVVSPDESLLLLSNSRNGEIMQLPRQTNGTEGRNQFPFVHAADLAETSVSSFIASTHQRPVNDISFSNDGQRVVTASDDRSIGVWRVLPGESSIELMERLEGHGARVNAAAFVDPNGHTVLSASADRFCRLWNVDRYQQQKKELEEEFDISRSERATQAKVSRKATRYIFTKSRESPNDEDAAPEYRVINADGDQQRGAIKSIDLSSDGRRLVTGAADGSAIIWDTDTGKPITGVSTRSGDAMSFDEGHDFNVARLRFLPPKGNILLTTGFDGNLCLWNADISRTGAGNEEVRIPGLGLVNAVATSDDGTLIATSAASDVDQKTGSASIWKTTELLTEATPDFLVQLNGFHRAEVSAISISPDNRYVATGARDGRVAVWSIKTGERLAGGQIHAKNTIVSHLQWMPDDGILSAGFDGRLMIVDASDLAEQSPETPNAAKPLRIRSTFVHDRIPIERVACSFDRERFVTISVRTNKSTSATVYELQLWNVASTDASRRIIPANVQGQKPRRIAAVSWSPDGNRLAAVIDGHLQLFKTTSWRVEKVLNAPGLGISDAVFAPAPTGGQEKQASVLATFDGTASHLWNLDDYSHVADFRPLFAVQSVEICEGNHPVLLTGDRAVRIFDADGQSEEFGGTLAKISDPHRGIITSLKFAADNQTFVSTGADGSASAWLWDAKEKSATPIRKLQDHGTGLVAADISADGTRTVLVASDGTVTVFDLKTPNNKIAAFAVSPDTTADITSGAISADGQKLAIAGQIAETGESIAWIYSLPDDNAAPMLHCTIRGHEAGGITGIQFLPDSPYVVTGGADGDVLVWNWQPNRAIDAPLEAYEAYQFLVKDQPRAHNASVSSVSVAQTGLIATSSEDGTAIVWTNPFARERSNR